MDRLEVSALSSSPITYFAAKGDTPSPDALTKLRACHDPATLHSWLQRAYQGETWSQIFES